MQGKSELQHEKSWERTKNLVGDKVNSHKYSQIHLIIMEIVEEKYFVSLGMRERGGSFVKAIGEALLHADMTNVQKLKETWPEYWMVYLKWGQKIDKQK
ncbi:hypothetical protein LCGC14_2055470 [marine sediment metagenome]|uniref:Uncharacterized protein n=1 Tax=marine sediment metagenome TaxID=412755 RepID=A0A0F9EMV8_9ZZZZ